MDVTAFACCSFKAVLSFSMKLPGCSIEIVFCFAASDLVRIASCCCVYFALSNRFKLCSKSKSSFLKSMTFSCFQERGVAGLPCIDFSELRAFCPLRFRATALSTLLCLDSGGVDVVWEEGFVLSITSKSATSTPLIIRSAKCFLLPDRSATFALMRVIKDPFCSMLETVPCTESPLVNVIFTSRP